MLKPQLLHVMAFLILIGKTISSSAKTPSKTAQIGQDSYAEPSQSKDGHSNEMVLVRSRLRLGKGEFRLLLGSTCPSFLHGRYRSEAYNMLFVDVVGPVTMLQSLLHSCTTTCYKSPLFRLKNLASHFVFQGVPPALLLPKVWCLCIF